MLTLGSSKNKRVSLSIKDSITVTVTGNFISFRFHLIQLPYCTYVKMVAENLSNLTNKLAVK